VNQLVVFVTATSRTSVISKRRKHWEDRSKISKADQKAARSQPEAVEHSDAGKLHKVP